MVYLDHSSATPTSPEVLKAMEPFFLKTFANPSSLHQLGVESRKAVEDSRKIVANLLGTQPDSIIYVSGGTEANNLAIFGSTRGLKPGHIITTRVEHSSVLEPIKRLESEGWKITYLPVNSEGFVNPSDLAKSLNSETVLVSIMYANNEVGSIQQISELGKIVNRFKKSNNSTYPFFHTDACQAPEYLPLQVEKLHVDLMSLNGGKIYGPKGIGVLYKRRGINLSPIILGGGQEGSVRSGTENVASIVGFAKALQVSTKKSASETIRLRKLTKYLIDELKKLFPNLVLNGPELGEGRLPNNLNFSVGNIEGEKFVLYLDSFNILCSTASACTESKNEPSHVLKAIGLSEKDNRSSVRFSLGRGTSKDELKYTISSIKKIKQICKI